MNRCFAKWTRKSSVECTCSGQARKNSMMCLGKTLVLCDRMQGVRGDEAGQGAFKVLVGAGIILIDSVPSALLPKSSFYSFPSSCSLAVFLALPQCCGTWEVLPFSQVICGKAIERDGKKEMHSPVSILKGALWTLFWFLKLDFWVLSYIVAWVAR